MGAVILLILVNGLNYIVDMYGARNANSAIAANTVVRSMFGAGFAGKMLGVLGVAWGFGCGGAGSGGGVGLGESDEGDGVYRFRECMFRKLFPYLAFPTAGNSFSKAPRSPCRTRNNPMQSKLLTTEVASPSDRSVKKQNSGVTNLAPTNIDVDTFQFRSRITRVV